ncbi:CynX/NimT family MFS transporter [Zafaria sp. J156]|uniref:MFS transporter n=1 Tax=Zafaria sp. J156 TaxID=3116490 RepID=UPI002E78A408|nr:MFS transporter [Zafaria sp. J156]MEE1621917.1 MFS transporter [Zafaria sp. J156]
MAPPASSIRPALPWVLVGIIVLALNLRAPIIAPTAVVPDIRADTGLGAAGVGMLTGLPVLLFALATPLATRTIRRFGPETTVVLCLAGVLAGTVIRSLGPTPVIMAGTVLIGAAMTLGNIVVPVLIRRDVPWNRVGAATGAYSAVMNVGSMATLLGTPPLAAQFGWRWAIASWGVVTAAALAFWLVKARRLRLARGTTPMPPSPRPAPADPVPSLPGGPGAPHAAAGPAADDAAGRRMKRITALLLLGFCGQSGAYYATTAWLPTLLADTRGLAPAASGASASLFQIAAIVGALGVPLVAARTRAWIPVVLVGALWMALPIGLLVAPEAFVVWSLLGGVAQGGGFTAIFSIVPRIARSDAEAAAASARIQAGGYLAATAAPPVAGWLNAATHGWTAPLLLVFALAVLFTAGSVAGARLSERR